MPGTAKKTLAIIDDDTELLDELSRSFGSFYNVCVSLGDPGTLRLLHDKLGDRRLFTIGIGPSPNSFFLAKAAQAGRGTFTFIDRDRRIRLAVEQVDSWSMTETSVR